MLFSIVIPCYNAEPHIVETLESVLDQTCPDFEVIVVDDASTDGTLDLVRRFSERDPRIRVLCSTIRSGGPATPRNSGTADSKGDYVAFLDADDLWCRDKLLNDAEFLRKSPVDILFSGTVYFQGQNRKTIHVVEPQPLRWSFLFRNTIPLSTVCVRRQLFSEEQLLFDSDPLLVGIEDYHFLLSAYLRGIRIACRPGIDAYYRMNSRSSIYRRNDFGLIMRRLVYNFAKVAAKHSVGTPKLLAGLAASVSFFTAKRLLGRL